MNEIKKCIALTIVMSLITAIAKNFTDADVKRHILAECSVIDGVEYAEWQYKVAMRKCEWDTNRFVRLVKELVPSAKGTTKYNLFNEVGWHGGVSDLPYLQGYLTDEELAVPAARGIMRICGVTTNSIDCVNGLLCMTNMSQDVRSEVCADLFWTMCGQGVSSGVREYGVSNVLVYAKTANRSFEHMDWRMCAADHRYKYSHERLAVLRSVKDPMAHPSLYQYITNSIRELVEYPESNLIHFLR